MNDVCPCVLSRVRRWRKRAYTIDRRGLRYSHSRIRRRRPIPDRVDERKRDRESLRVKADGGERACIGGEQRAQRCDEHPAARAIEDVNLNGAVAGGHDAAVGLPAVRGVLKDVGAHAHGVPGEGLAVVAGVAVPFECVCEGVEGRGGEAGVVDAGEGTGLGAR